MANYCKDTSLLLGVVGYVSPKLRIALSVAAQAELQELREFRDKWERAARSLADIDKQDKVESLAHSGPEDRSRRSTFWACFDLQSRYIILESSVGQSIDS